MKNIQFKFTVSFTSYMIIFEFTVVNTLFVITTEMERKFNYWQMIWEKFSPIDNYKSTGPSLKTLNIK